MKRNALFLIFSLGLLSAHAQTGDEAYRFALHNYAKQNYNIAAKEYNRALFLGCLQQETCFWQIARCYAQMGQHDLANQFFDKAYFSLSNDSLKTDLLLEKAFANIMQKDFNRSYYELLNVDSLYSPKQNRDYWLYLGVSFYGLDDFEHARECFAENLSEEKLEELNAAFIYLKKMQKRHRPGRVETMSYLLPGLGQIHTGNVKAGLNSAALLGAIFYGMVRISILYSPFDGLVIFAPWFQRYYMGGVDKAHQMAVEKIAIKKNETFNRIIDIHNNNE